MLLLRSATVLLVRPDTFCNNEKLKHKNLTSQAWPSSGGRVSGMGRLTSDLGPIKDATNITPTCTNNKNRPKKTKKVSKKCVNCDKSCICNKMAYAQTLCFCPYQTFSTSAALATYNIWHLRIKCNSFQTRNNYFSAKTGQKSAQIKVPPQWEFYHLSWWCWRHRGWPLLWSW